MLIIWRNGVHIKLPNTKNKHFLPFLRNFLQHSLKFQGFFSTFDQFDQHLGVQHPNTGRNPQHIVRSLKGGVVHIKV